MAHGVDATLTTGGGGARGGVGSGTNIHVNLHMQYHAIDARFLTSSSNFRTQWSQGLDRKWGAQKLHSA